MPCQLVGVNNFPKGNGDFTAPWPSGNHGTYGDVKSLLQKWKEEFLSNLLCSIDGGSIASARLIVGEKSEVVFDVSVSVEGRFSDEPD
jgi:hypothetical protein